MSRSAANLVAITSLLMFLGASHVAMWANDLTAMVASLPTLSFAPSGTAQQIAVIWESLVRRRHVRNDRLTAPN